MCRDHGFPVAVERVSGTQRDMTHYRLHPKALQRLSYCLVLSIILLDTSVFPSLAMVSFLKAGVGSDFSILQKLKSA